MSTSGIRSITTACVGACTERVCRVCPSACEALRGHVQGCAALCHVYTCCRVWPCLWGVRRVWQVWPCAGVQECESAWRRVQPCVAVCGCVASPGMGVSCRPPQAPALHADRAPLLPPALLLLHLPQPAAAAAADATPLLGLLHPQDAQTLYLPEGEGGLSQQEKVGRDTAI